MGTLPSKADYLEDLVLVLVPPKDIAVYKRNDKGFLAHMGSISKYKNTSLEIRDFSVDHTSGLVYVVSVIQNIYVF